MLTAKQHIDADYSTVRQEIRIPLGARFAVRVHPHLRLNPMVGFVLRYGLPGLWDAANAPATWCIHRKEDPAGQYLLHK